MGSSRRRAKSARLHELRVKVYTAARGALSTGAPPSPAGHPRAGVPASGPLNWADADRRGLLTAAVLVRPRRWPMAPGLIGRCGPARGRPGFRCARTELAARSPREWTWPVRPASRSTPRVRARWCSPVCWRAARWCRCNTRAGCGPATSRWRPRFEPVSGSTGRRCWAGCSPVTRAVRRRPACIGVRWGPAARADYVDPLGLLASTLLRLKPLAGELARGWAWSCTARSRATVTCV